METQLEQPASPPWWRILLFGRRPKRTAGRIVVLIIVCFVVFKFVLLPIRVEGISMQPTYKEHRIDFVNCAAYLFHEPRRGDVVAIPISVKGRHAMLMKRIVALPEETIAFHQGRLWINGAVQPEPYVKLGCDWEMSPIKLGPNEYYVVGDNRSMPQAFHEQGVSKRSQIVGKVLL